MEARGGAGQGREYDRMLRELRSLRLGISAHARSSDSTEGHVVLRVQPPRLLDVGQAHHSGMCEDETKFHADSIPPGAPISLR